MSQFKQFWIKDFVVFKTHERYADGASVREAYDKPAPNRKIHVIEYAALEAAQKEIEELKLKLIDRTEKYSIAIDKGVDKVVYENKKLTAALKVAEDAIQATVWQKVKGYPTWQEWENIWVKNKDARLEIQKIKKGLG